MTNGRGSTRGWLLPVARTLITARIRARAARPREVPEDPALPPVERDHADRVVASVTVLVTSNHLAVCSASPQIACITNVWADHVDQHGSLAAYLEAKRRIVAFQAPGATRVLVNSR